MRQATKIFIFFLLTLGILQANEITFGVYTSDKASVMYKKFKPILNYLEQDAKKQGVDINIKLKIYPSYKTALEGIVKGEYDFARFGPASYILASEQNPNIKLLAMEHKKGKKVFNGAFITKEDSSIKSLKDLDGKSFAFGNAQSTIGRYLAQAELLDAGLNHTNFAKYDYLGRHDKVALAVANGDYDAGVVKESTLKKYKDRGLKVISTFQNVTKPWIVRADFDPKTFTVLQNSLLNLKDKKVLKVVKKSGFLKAITEDYTIIKKGMDKSKQF